MSGNSPGGHLRLVADDADQEETSTADSLEMASPEYDELASSATFSKHSAEHMEDKDVQRLEDRIEATEERGRLRLEVAMTKIDSKLDGLAMAIQEVGRLSSAQAAESTVRYRELRNTVIVTGVAVLFGIGAILIGLKQVWIGGVQVGLPLGQVMQGQQAPLAATPQSTLSPQQGSVPAVPSNSSSPKSN